MINGEKIGVGIVTCGRPELFQKLVDSLDTCSDIVDFVYVVEDTIEDKVLNENLQYSDVYCGKILKKSNLTWLGIFNTENNGVGKSKNKCLEHLRKINCDHIFLIEDDIFIKDPTVFEKYIEASKVTGIQHFNYSQHGMMNKSWPGGSPNPRIIIDYKPVAIRLYPHCVGAFSYYSKRCLESVGNLDERYYNACEHVDHTYEIIKHNMHPPFWYFADIDNSWEYLGDEEWSREKSTISSNPNHQKMMQDADKIFVEKHGHLPVQTVDVGKAGVYTRLKEIRQMYGSNTVNM